MLLKKLLILDRDGVINQAPKVSERYILNVKDLQLHNNILEIITEAQKNQWFVCSATNQQALGKGLITLEGLTLIHNHINETISLFGGKPILFFVCSHLQSDSCDCRKPMPGLLLQAMEAYCVSIDTDQIVFVGDQETDRFAAKLARIAYLPFSKNLKFLDIVRKLEKFQQHTFPK
jgi:D-glycero-D-manno-heptose 1,7-bisphosphate phosphatase